MKDKELVTKEPTVAPQLNLAEKQVVKFLDARIDLNPEKMRELMSENFQADYDFSVIDSQKPKKNLPVSFRIIRTSKEAGSYAVVAEILFENQKNHKQKTISKVYDLVEDLDSKKLLVNSEKNLKSDKPFYKKPFFWFLVVAGLALITGIVYWALTNQKTTQNQQSIKTNWHLIVDGAKGVNDAAASATKDQTSYDNYSKKLDDYRNLMGDVKFRADQLSPVSSDKDDITRYREALVSLNDYIAEAANQSKDVANLNTADISKLNDLSGLAEQATNRFQDNAKYLSDKMPPEIFNIDETLSKQKDKLDEAKLKEQEAQDAATNAAAQDAANKTTVTNNVTTFEQGYIAGNATVMRPVMTSGFQGEYDFNQLTPEQRQFQYPSSFRIISVAKQTDGTYKAQVNVLYKYTDNPNQYTQGYEYSVISQSGKWLINNEKTVSGF